MRVALVSYEYPPDTAFGGIGTYVHQVVEVLVKRGHSVEVFAASGKRTGHFQHGAIGVNLVAEMDREKFALAIASVFSKRRAVCDFDVVESPEYFADGREILKSHPDIPHVVKLHTPNQLIRHSNAPPSFLGWRRHNSSQARVILGAWRRGKRAPHYERYLTPKPSDVELDARERNYVKACSFVTAPSKAMAEWAIREWEVDRAKTMVVPNPYVPSEELLRLVPVTKRKVIGFFGRLEYRKGICSLIEAIPTILKSEPNTVFRFVGKALQHPVTNKPFDAFILRALEKFRRNLEIVGAASLHEMPAEYGKVDICVFPSIWENFPNVCLEAMSAGKAVIASNSGGMAEMLDANCGILVSPNDPRAIANAAIRLLRSDDLRMQMGLDSRKRVLERYSVASVGPLVERSYERAIAVNHQKSPRQEAVRE